MMLLRLEGLTEIESASTECFRGEIKKSLLELQLAALAKALFPEGEKQYRPKGIHNIAQGRRVLTAHPGYTIKFEQKPCKGFTFCEQ